MEDSSDETPLAESAPLSANDPSFEPGRVLNLIGNSSVREILRHLSDEPRAIPDLVEQVDISRATVYRLVGDLIDVGLVTESYHPTEHQQIIRLNVNGLAVVFGPELTVRALTDMLARNLPLLLTDLAQGMQGKGETEDERDYGPYE